jgi:PAS domain S-box-containing protein
MSTSNASSGTFDVWVNSKRLLLYSGLTTIAMFTPFLVWPSLRHQLMSSNFVAHRFCFLGRPGVIWTHVTADMLIALAYFSISITLVFLVYQGRREIPFHWTFLAFGLFIVACGGTHLVEVITFWRPVYVFSGALKVFTAAASIATAVFLPFNVPKVLMLVRQARDSVQVAVQLQTSEKRKEALMRELQERKKMFEQFFASAPDAILVTDAEGRITELNREAERLFGYSSEELIGQMVEILVPDYAKLKHSEKRAAYSADPKNRHIGQGLELYARKKNGTLAAVDIGLSPLEAGGELRIMASVRDTTEHKIAAEKLRESLREKEVLLREVHHRVKNNLAVICSLFYLESTYAKDEHAARVFRESESRVHSMALVHESLYGSHNLARIDFSQYAKTLATDILFSHGGQRKGNGENQLKADLDAVIMSIELAVPCGLILNELISNAIKHGLPQGGGEITLTLRRLPNDRCLLSVDDSGTGVPDGLDLDSHRSLGLRLVQSLTKQIRGTFVLQRIQPGTSARVEFPVDALAR